MTSISSSMSSASDRISGQNSVDYGENFGSSGRSHVFWACHIGNVGSVKLVEL